VSGDPLFRAFCEAGLWPGLGRTTAARLPDAGVSGPGDVTVTSLRQVEGVSAARAERLVGTWTAGTSTYAVAGLLHAAGLPVRGAKRAVAELGAGAADVLRRDPWRLLDVPEATLLEADRLARSIEPSVRRDDPRRGRALVAHVLARAARDGHTVQPLDVVLAAVRGEGIEDAAAAVEAALSGDRVLAFAAEEPAEEDAVTLLGLARFAMAEEAVAEGLARLVATASKWGDETSVQGVGAAAGLDGSQLAAVVAAVRHGVSVLTGGPGTGKSRTVAAVVEHARRRRKRVALAAPTGRAAKRLEELAGEPATTLHRLLGAQGTTGEFLRGEDWPLDADLVVVDEASMLDGELAAALVEACDDGTHLLVVGDPAQLPSIGAGRVLGDLVDSEAVPVAELTTLYRQAEGGAIARLAAAVRSGELPPVDDPSREVVVVRARDAGEAAHRTVQLVTDSIPRALGIAPDDVQVVTPVHRGPAGTLELNRVLKARLNPGDGQVGGFDVGDRVVATANHLTPGGSGPEADAGPGFANGEVGVVTGLQDGGLVVTFPGGPVPVPASALGDLRHGWAVTVHRAQGSEWPAVVAVLPGEAAGMLSRPLVYTGFTRAQRHLSVVHAAGPAVARAVRQVGARPRRTRLRDLLREEVPAATEVATVAAEGRLGGAEGTVRGDPDD
jgi:exodeoxyribonuclease V alpha subunit